MNRKLLLTSLGMLGLMLPARAADTSDPPAEAESKTENKAAQTQASKLAARFNVTEKEVSDLRNRGLGWGEIRHALAISRRANVPVADVIKLRDSGMGWGRIARQYGFSLGQVSGKGGTAPAGRNGRGPGHRGWDGPAHERHGGGRR